MMSCLGCAAPGVELFGQSLLGTGGTFKKDPVQLSSFVVLLDQNERKDIKKEHHFVFLFSHTFLFRYLLLPLLPVRLQADASEEGDRDNDGFRLSGGCSPGQGRAAKVLRRGCLR